MAEIFKCNLCMYENDCFRNFEKHYRKHKNDPHFQVSCCIGSCAYTSKNWNTYRVHVYRKHRDHLRDQTNEGQRDEEQDDNDMDHMELAEEYEQEEQIDPTHFSAMFTLTLEARDKVDKSTINTVVSNAKVLLDSGINHFKRQVKAKLAAYNIDPNIIESIPVENFLDDLDADHKRQRFYSDNMETLVQPEEVILGKKLITKNGTIKEVQQKGYIIPCEKNITNLLKMPEVWSCVQNRRKSTDGFMYDIGDGKVARNHDVLSRNPSALQLIMNCDDLEIVNPLGSHIKKHKITVFYFMLGNIPPEYRSKLHTIQLIGVCKTMDIRENDALAVMLDDFIKTVNKLSSTGIEVLVHGQKHNIKGTLAMVAADTLAANWLGRFKEGVSFALRNCRNCDTENSQLRNKFVEREVKLRDLESHKERCTQLSELSREAFTYWSKLWGINGTSCLLMLDNFDLVKGLVQDPMHVLLEGVVPHELSQCLYHLIFVQKYFTLKWLNTAIAGFRYSYLHSGAKPERIERHHIDGKGNIKQSASAMLTLVHVLPFIIAHRIPVDDTAWTNALKLLQIVLLCTSTYCAIETASYLRILIAEYLYNFKILYPRASFIPKMHYLIHLPSQMLNFGPLRHHWCMRFEGKNGFLANKKYKNFKNIPKTLANRHQLHIAYQQSSSTHTRAEDYLYEGDQVDSGQEVHFGDVHPDLLDGFYDVTTAASDKVYLTESVTIHGKKYRRGCCIVLEYCDDEPVFAMLLNIFIVNHVKYFVLDVMDSVYDPHYLSYKLDNQDKKKIVSFSGLKFRWPLSVYKCCGVMAVMNTNSHTCFM